MMTPRHSDLLALKNLGMATVNILHAVGVSSEADLRQLGAVATYNRIKERDINVSKVMLYALEGALLDTHWNDLPSERKQQLVAQAERDLQPG